MKTPSELAGSARALWRDTSGLIAPYVAVMLPVLVGFSMLAVDASRFMSLQTQMQAAADNLALAGARELNKQSGAQTRAVSAMANAYASAKSANTTVGMGSSPTLTYTHTFYSSLNAASSGIGGTAATGDGDSKYVSVTVAPQTVSTIFPASFLNAVALNSFSAGASAVAGFGGISLCGVAPIFICNPYETSGMTDAAATAAINTAWADAATLRKQMKLSTASTPSPGNFGWVVTAGCTNSDTTCLRKAILNPKGACYNKTGIYLNTGSTTNNMGFFDTRFDIYSNQVQPGNLATPANSPPAINVRKGYLPQTTGGKVDWCKAATVNSTSPSKYYTYPNKVATTATETGTGSTGTKKTLTNVGNATGVDAGDTITSAATGFPTADTTVSNVAGTGPYTVTMSNPATASATINVTFDWNTSGLPEDKSFTGFQGNGDWDCANYWDVTLSAPRAIRRSAATRFIVTKSATEPGLAGSTIGRGITAGPATAKTTRKARPPRPQTEIWKPKMAPPTAPAQAA